MAEASELAAGCLQPMTRLGCQSPERRSGVWPSRQPPLTKNLMLWNVCGLVDQSISKIRKNAFDGLAY